METVSDADGRTDGHPDGGSQASRWHNSVVRVSGRTGEDAYLVEGRTVPVGHGMGMIKDARGWYSGKTHGASGGDVIIILHHLLVRYLLTTCRSLQT
mgnify:CR=1 FL=1